MDTITHGIAGALIGKAVFGGGDLLTERPATNGPSRERVLTWAAMLGAIFPDSDAIRHLFSRNEMLVLTWHRGMTHSLLCVPAFALGLAALTQWFLRRRKWECPSFALLTLIYAIALLSHIFLDLATSFGTMIWSPLAWTRPALDLLFILDFSFSAIVLLPQLLSSVYERPENAPRRALRWWLLSVLAVLVISGVSRVADVAISPLTVLGVTAFLAALFFAPLLRGRGFRVSRAAWCRAGLLLSVAYLGGAVVAHRAALARVERFAEVLHLPVQSLAALPAAPSVWRWEGLVRTPHGVYELRMDLAEREASAGDATHVLEYRFYPEAPANPQIERVRRMPEVQKVLWFARFPVTRFHREGSQAVVEIVDLRFRSTRPGHAAPFTYQVRLDRDGRILAQGWARE
ncbi:MAG: metal-dependent hydrolase [Acidobacteriia bacterium]|nr:metal-dependent hydrolase [Terriglobia bacterium]